MTTTSTPKTQTAPVALVYDGSSFQLPQAMGTPSEGQCEGTPAEHPLIREFLQHEKSEASRRRIDDRIKGAKSHSRVAYMESVEALQYFLLERGADKQTARKQARGAARGYLGNALQTEMLFSANVHQWRWMLHERGSQFADAETREIFAGRMIDVNVNPDTTAPALTPCVLTALRESRYRDSFNDIELHDSPDGLCNMTVMPDPKLDA